MSSPDCCAYIEGGEIVIRVAIKVLPGALRFSPWNPPDFVVTDTKVFAKAVVEELNRETENGTTPIHRMMDAAMDAAIESGCEGIEAAKGEP